MAFPTTAEELNAQGYKFKNGGFCRGCGVKIQWYETPNGKAMPLDMDYKPHWGTCPKADQFRKGKTK